MFKLAWRNLTNEPTRMAISVAGIALALVLILVISGIFAGSEEFAVAYIKNEPAPIWLMQSGVANMHMSSSYISPEMINEAEQIEGVKDITGVLYTGGNLESGEDSIIGYIIGVDPQAEIGGPWKLVEGRQNPERGEIIIDAELAKRLGVELGDEVSLFNTAHKIIGLSRGNFGIGSSMAFINKQALSEWMAVPPDAASFALVRPETGIDVNGLAGRMRSALTDLNVMQQAEFAASDKDLIRQMGVDIIRAMNIIAYIVGLLVIGLTIYTATLERSREYGMLKALGANNTRLAVVVLCQALISAALGILLGVGVAYGAGALITKVSPDMLILIDPAYVWNQVPILAVVTGIAALLPASRIARLDPMIAFKA
jgi:putative ABC transport system permease protein